MYWRGCGFVRGWKKIVYDKTEREIEDDLTSRSLTFCFFRVPSPSFPRLRIFLPSPTTKRMLSKRNVKRMEREDIRDDDVGTIVYRRIGGLPY